MLPHARLRLQAAVDTPLRLPDYAGSTLRGAFGGALRRIACMTHVPTCTGCPLLHTEIGDLGLRLHRDIKAALDPDNLLNPGKVF